MSGDKLFCDICGEEIQPGEKCYCLPDGFVICTESDCLEKWLEKYEGFA